MRVLIAGLLQAHSTRRTILEMDYRTFFGAIPRAAKVAFGLGIPLACFSISTVPAGYVGYLNLFGDVDKAPRTSGIHLKNPFASMVKISLRTENFTSEIEVASNEGLTIAVQLDTIYHIQESSSRKIYINYRYDYEHIIIKPLVQSVLRDVISSYEAKALYSDKTREEIARKLKARVTDLLLENGFVVNNVLINKIRLPLQLLASIENKLKTEQENEQMHFTIEKERQQQHFRIEKEKLEAERKKIEAEGIQAFQTIVSKGISKQLLKWKGIEATEHLAKSQNAKVVIIGNPKNGLPIVLN